MSSNDVEAQRVDSRAERESRVDVNYPVYTTDADVPQFQEYTAETADGLVPLASISSAQPPVELQRTETVLSRAITRMQSELGAELAPDNIEFVTWRLNDPENPRNWSRPRKWRITLLQASAVVCAAFGSAVITLVFDQLQEEFHCSEYVATLTCSFMVAGFMMGNLLWAGCSETIGRRKTYAFSLGVYVILNIPCALSPTIAGQLVARFLSGVFASSVLVLAGGVIADVWDGDERGMAIAFFAAAPYSGPVLGPLVSGWIDVTTTWRWCYWANMIFSGIIWVMLMLCPETYAPVLLKWRAKRLRKESGNPNIMTEQELFKAPLSQVVQEALIRPFRLIFSDPVLDLMNLYILLIYALLYALFFSFPVIFGDLYGWHNGLISLTFISVLVGAALALCVTPLLERKYRHDIRVRGYGIPEDRLVGAMIASPLIPIALFILGSTSHKGMPWIAPCISGLPFGLGMVIIYYSVNGFIIDYATHVASALAAKTFMRSSGAAVSLVFITPMYRNMGLLWASFTFAFISLGMVAIPFIFYLYGPRLRKFFKVGGRLPAHLVDDEASDTTNAK